MGGSAQMFRPKKIINYLYCIIIIYFLILIKIPSIAWSILFRRYTQRESLILAKLLAKSGKVDVLQDLRRRIAGFFLAPLPDDTPVIFNLKFVINY